MKKITIIVICLLTSNFIQAQTKLFNLEFISGKVYINQTNSKETTVVQPITGFLCDKNSTSPTFSFSSSNINRTLQYSQINSASFDGDAYEWSTATQLGDTIEHYLRRFSYNTADTPPYATQSNNSFEAYNLDGAGSVTFDAFTIHGMSISGDYEASYNLTIDGEKITYDHGSNLVAPVLNSFNSGPISSEITIEWVGGNINVIVQK